MCCWQSWPQLGDTGWPTHSILYGCYCICYTGKVHSQEIPTQNCENGRATSSWPQLHLQLCDLFCWVRLSDALNTKCPTLCWHQSNNWSSVENVLVVSLSTPSLVCWNAGHTQGFTSGPVFCQSDASGRHWHLRNVGHCVNTDLCDTVKCYSTMSIFTFDQLLWWMTMTTIKNKQEPSLHGIMLRLVGFHTPASYLEAVSGSGLWSLFAFDPWDSLTNRDYWEPGSCIIGDS